MPLLGGPQARTQSSGTGIPPKRRESEQFSGLAKIAMVQSSLAESHIPDPHSVHHDTLAPPSKTAYGKAVTQNGMHKPPPQFLSLGHALTDTPAPTPHSSHPTSPQIPARSGLSGASTPKLRATTLDIPGLTKSKVSPDGRIAERDVGAKLIIIMVGLPARGKSYLVKKIARYLNWLQHPTRIFNVGDRRRVAAGPRHQHGHTGSIDGALKDSVRKMSLNNDLNGIEHQDPLPPPAMMLNEMANFGNLISPLQMSGPAYFGARPASPSDDSQHVDQSADFFDPNNIRAKRIRERVAHDTLDDLLKYVLEDGGSVGILDATNHTRDRRQSLIDHLRKRDPDINFMFLESKCQDMNLLEANMRLKLSGPDYKDKDPVIALKDFEERVHQYEKMYQPVGEWEEERNMPYCSLIDVGRKMVSHQVKGFLMISICSYFMNFNLAPRQIWLTRHGESMDNVNGRIGGDSDLSPQGIRYARTLTKFVGEQRRLWELHQIEKQATTHFPPRPGDTTPPNPEVAAQVGEVKNFCVWTSMLKRSVETSQFFNEEEYDLKQMRMLDELNSGYMEGMTYESIKEKYPEEYALRKQDKLQYRYPGPGGEGYLDIISRVRKVVSLFSSTIWSSLTHTDSRNRTND